MTTLKTLTGMSIAAIAASHFFIMASAHADSAASNDKTDAHQAAQAAHDYNACPGKNVCALMGNKCVGKTATKTTKTAPADSSDKKSQES